MIGIKSAVSKIGEIPIKTLDLKIPYLFPVDNLGVYEEMNRFQYEQNNYDGIIKCKFYDYAPKIFYNLRSLYGISNDDYLKSLGPENFLCNLIITKNKSLKEICSSGKSGSFFYFSYDSKYLMKTIPESEFNKFKEMLQDYYLYMYEHPKTLLQRFFGLYVCIFNETKMHFVVMNNVFNTSLHVHYKFDLKGSTYKRRSRKDNDTNYENYDYDIAMKDNDFEDRKEVIDLSPFYKKILATEAKNDSKFLSDHNINDYSFLIGVYDQKFNNKEVLPQEQLMILSGNNNIKHHKTSIPNNVARKPFYEEYYGGIQSEDKTKVYFFGIIDIFTNYGASKKVEYIVKSVSQGKGISCKPPNEYSQRFIRFIDKILNVINDDNKTLDNKKDNNYIKEEDSYNNEDE
jgi:1-phosphatidylinositol-4-phosphate 5-kinase